MSGQKVGRGQMKVFMKLSQNVYFHELYVRYETRSHWVKTRSPGQILEKTCTLQWTQFKCNVNETLPDCLSQLNLGQDQNWVIPGQIIEKTCELLEGTVLIQSS